MQIFFPFSSWKKRRKKVFSFISIFCFTVDSPAFFPTKSNSIQILSFLRFSSFFIFFKIYSLTSTRTIMTDNYFYEKKTSTSIIIEEIALCLISLKSSLVIRAQKMREFTLKFHSENICIDIWIISLFFFCSLFDCFNRGN